VTVPELLERWRADAELLRRRGAAVQADVLLGCAEELEQQQREDALEALTLEQAARESGYTVSALDKQLRDRKLENVGQRGAPRVRRGDLPKKGGRVSRPSPGIADLALHRRGTA
jgi:hypothetical protein